MVSRVVMGNSGSIYGLKTFDEKDYLIVDSTTPTTATLKAETIDIEEALKRNRRSRILSRKNTPSNFSTWSKKNTPTPPLDDFDGLGLF